MEKRFLVRVFGLVRGVIFGVLVLAVVIGTGGCAAERAGSDSAGTLYVVVAGEEVVEYSVQLEDVTVTNGVLSVLEYLAQTDELVFEVQSTALGAYLTKIGDIEQNLAQNQFISIHTSVENDFDVSIYATTITYNNTTLKSSAVGISQMLLKKDAIIHFSPSSW